MLWRRQIHFNLIMFPFPFSFNTELNYFLILPNQMQVQQPKYLGLVADLLPNIRLMQGFGHFLFRYITGPILIRKIYSSVHLVLLLFQFVCIIMNLAQNTDEVSELTCNYWTQLKKLLILKSSLPPANTITVLFFSHCIVKFIYVALNADKAYRTLGIWNQSNTHPLFAESDAR